MPALARAILTCCLGVSTPSILGSNNPFLKPLLTITPYFSTSKSSMDSIVSGAFKHQQNILNPLTLPLQHYQI